MNFEILLKIAKLKYLIEQEVKSKKLDIVKNRFV